MFMLDMPILEFALLTAGGGMEKKANLHLFLFITPIKTRILMNDHSISIPKYLPSAYPLYFIKATRL